MQQGSTILVALIETVSRILYMKEKNLVLFQILKLTPNSKSKRTKNKNRPNIKTTQATIVVSLRAHCSLR